MQHRPIETIMSPVLSKVGPGVRLQNALNLMAERDHSCVVVVSPEGQPLGVVTERDVVRLLSHRGGNIGNLTTGEIMSTPPVTVLPSLSLHEAIYLSRARKLRHLLVVNEQRLLLGIVTQTDMVRVYLESIDGYRQELETAVKLRTEELESENRELLDLAMEDPLTKIGNRRAMEIDLNFTQTSAKRYGDPYQIVLLDVDHFKSYNDYYGHQAGDDALQKMAQLIRGALRDSDRLYRYGGEEFLLILPKASLQQAQSIADRARENISDANIEHKTSPFGCVTVSGGVAKGSDTDWRESVKNADKALYQAKKSGRNSVVAVSD